MKKVISLLIALAMILALVPAVFAEEENTTISEICIDGVPNLDFGSDYDTANIILPDGANYTITNAYMLDYAVGSPSTSGSFCNADVYYELYIELAPADGCTFETNPEVVVNGTENYNGWNLFSAYFENSYGLLVFDHIFEGSGSTVNTLSDINLWDAPTYILAGETAVSPIGDMCVGDSPANILNAEWMVLDEAGEYTWFDGEFVADETYYLGVVVEPTDDYILADSVSVCFYYGYYQYFWSTTAEPDRDGSTVTVYVPYTALTEAPPENVDIVELNGLPDSIEADPEIPTGISASDNVTITDIYWECEGNYDYYLVVALEPAEGYTFSADYYSRLWSYSESGSDKEGWINVNEDGTACAYIYYSAAPIAESVTITVTEPVLGGSQYDVSITVDGAELYSSWWNNTITWEDFEIFEEGSYCLGMALGSNEYQFVEDVTEVIVNAPANCGISCGFYDYLYVYIDYYFGEKTPLEQVAIDLPYPEYDCEYYSDWCGACYWNEAFESWWYMNSTAAIYENGVAVDSGWFTEGEYLVEMTIYPNTGYCFTDDTVVYAETNGWNLTSCVVNEDGSATVTLTATVTIPGTPVYGAEIYGLPEEIVAGETATAPELWVGDSWEGGCSVTGVEWLDANYESFSGAFVDGDCYYLAITLSADEGSEFYWDFYAYLYTAYGNWVDSTYPEQDATTAVIYVEYSLEPTIDSLTVSFDEIVVGNAPTDPTVDAAFGEIDFVDWSVLTEDDYGMYWTGFDTFEDNARYNVYFSVIAPEGYIYDDYLDLEFNGAQPYNYYCWVDGDTLWIEAYFSTLPIIDRVDITMPEPEVGDSLLTEDDIVIETEGVELSYFTIYNWTSDSDVFEKLEYYVYIEFSPSDAIFADDLEVYVNGEEVYSWGGGDWCGINTTIDLREEITLIEVPELPTAVVGETATVVELEAPEGANYTLEGYWYVADGTDVTYFEGTFEEGKAYYFVVYASPTVGYCFGDNTVMTVAGEQADPQNIGSDWANYFVLNNLGAEVIDTVEITVTLPAAGEESTEPTTPEDAPYYIEEFVWAYGESADINDVEEFEELLTFEYDNYYWLGMALYAEEGYIFADELTVLINGVAYTVDAQSYSLAGLSIQYVEMGKLTEEVVEPETESDIPDTGDTAPIAVMVALAVLSSFAVAGTVVSKKKFF